MGEKNSYRSFGDSSLPATSPTVYRGEWVHEDVAAGEWLNSDLLVFCTGGGIWHVKHDPHSGNIHPLPFWRTRMGKEVEGVCRHTHTYIYTYVLTYRHTCMHIYVYALIYAHNKTQLSDKITNFSLPYSRHSIFHIEFSKHINPNPRAIAKVSVTVTYYETFIPFPPPLLPQ